MEPSGLHKVRPRQGDGRCLTLTPGKVTISTPIYVKEVMVDAPIVGGFNTSLDCELLFTAGFITY